MPLWSTLFDSFYPEATRARDILCRHSRSVADLALEINLHHSLGLDPQLVEAAAMLHDIGVFLVNAPSIGCYGLCPYIRHGILGADLIRRYGLPEEIALVAERHTGAGITPADIISMHLPLPTNRTYLPETTLQQLVCYADKFYSKSANMNRKPLDRVRASLAKFSPDTLHRFDTLHHRFHL
jgi:uncharacterized protein